MSNENQISGEQVKKLAALHCTLDQIAEILGTDTHFLTKYYDKEISAGRSEGKMRLLTMQFKAAQSGSAAMLIWLGKQFLGQRDTKEPPKVGKNQDNLTDEDVDDIIKKVAKGEQQRERSEERSTTEAG